MTMLRQVWPAVFVMVSIWFSAADAAKTPIPDFTKGDTIDLTKPGTPVDWNLGATGARGWMYGWFGSTRDSRQILITKVHKGTPADGILRKGDVILGIDGKPFTSNAREAFGKALTRAETHHGRGHLKLLRWRKGKTEAVTVQLEVMGSYSKTTPWNCKKSQKILDEACDYLISNKASSFGGPGISANIRILALMATGEEKYMPIVRAHIDKVVSKVARSGKNPPSGGLASWDWGYANLTLCEYYLLTKDKKVLPAIDKYSNALALGLACSGTWGHGMAPPDKITGKPHGALGGYGSMNQISTICWMSLILAERCGVNNSEIEQAITNAHKFMTYFIDIGGISYGDNLTGGRMHDDNGKTSAAAVAFAMYGDKKGTDFCSRMTVASHQQREYGHTGNYFNLLWGALGASLSGQQACGAFLREHCWVYDLERRWDGGFVYQGQGGNGNGYDPRTGRQRNNAGHQNSHWDTTGSRVLMYCLPRKKLVITGRDIFTYELKAAEVADTIQAPHRKHSGQYTTKDLVRRLASWSPVVRQWTGQDMAYRIRQNKGVQISLLTKMLRGRNRYGRYGACCALKSLGSDAKPAVNDLIACLNSEDRVLQLNAIMALGATDDMRAVTALLKMATSDIPDDKYDIVRRYIGTALFEGNQSLIGKIPAADRKLLMAATRRFLRSPTGHCRTLIGKNVALTLSLAEFKELRSDLDYAFYQTATTYNTAIQMAVLQVMAKYHSKEGIDLCVWYLANMKGHGSEKRVPKVLEILLEYGAHAKDAIEQLKKTAKYFDLCQVNHTVAELTKLAADFDLRNVPENFPRHLSKGKAKEVRKTIGLLEAMDDKQKAKIKLISTK